MAYIRDLLSYNEFQKVWMGHVTCRVRLGGCQPLPHHRWGVPAVPAPVAGFGKSSPNLRGWDWCPKFRGFVSHHQTKYHQISVGNYIYPQYLGDVKHNGTFTNPQSLLFVHNSFAAACVDVFLPPLVGNSIVLTHSRFPTWIQNRLWCL